MKIGHCFKLVAHFHDNHPNDVVQLLCKHFVGSHVLSVAMGAQRIVIDKVKSKAWSDIKTIQQLIQNLPPTKYQRLVGWLT